MSDSQPEDLAIFNTQLQQAEHALPDNGFTVLTAYVVVDAAQDKTLLPHLRSRTDIASIEPLLDTREGELESAVPWLVELPEYAAAPRLWQQLFRYGHNKPEALFLIASPADFYTLYAQLRCLTDVVMPDGEEMVLAYWDPAILGTLVGQKDDTTLHVPLRVLLNSQKKALLGQSAFWWYWDRLGNAHVIAPDEGAQELELAEVPLQLSDEQVDLMVEASVPDHLLSHIRMTQPQILLDTPVPEQYFKVKEYLRLGRTKYHLQGMQDLINFISLGFIYGDRLVQDTVVTDILKQVEQRQLSFADARAQLPE